MRYLTGILTVVLLAAMVCGQVAEPKPVVGPSLTPVSPDPMALLPADQQHIFGPVDPTWVKKRQWLEPNGSGHQLVDVDPHELNISWEDRYFEPGTPITPDAYRKLLHYSADGRLTQEIDRDGEKQWDWRFGPNKAVLEYTYYVSYGVNGLMAGFSIRQDGKVMSVLRNGTGDFIRWKADGDGFDRFVCHEGRVLVEETFSAGKGNAVILYAAQGQNSFRHDSGGEILSLNTRAEAWHFVENGAASYATSQRLSSPTWDGPPVPMQPTVGPDEISTRIRNGPGGGTRRGGPPTPEEIARREADAAQRLAEFRARRAEFFAADSDEIKAAGYTWESLGLAKLAAGPAADLPAPQPEWEVPPAATRPAGL